jgi:hypothetical protein
VNVDRRATGAVCIALLKECLAIGEMDDTSHVALSDAVRTMQNQEHWQLKNQEKHEGKNASTDKQIAISRVALPALEAAVQALKEDDYRTVLAKVELAITTDGTEPAKRKRK